MKNNLNLLFAAIFMIGFLVFWDSFVMKRYSAGPAKGAKPAVSSSTGGASSAPQAPSANTAKPLPSVGAEDKLIVLEAPGNKISFMSRGARIESWQIKERDHWIELVEPEKHRTAAPLQTFPDLNFHVEKKSDQEAVFSTVGPAGERITKTFKLLSNPPFHSLNISISNPTKNPVAVLFELPLGNGVDKHKVGTPYDPKGERAVLAETRAVGMAGNIKKWKPGFVFQRTLDLVDPSTFEWLAVDNNHFMLALLSATGIHQAKIIGDRDHSPVAIVPHEARLKPGEATNYSYELYVGPKDYSNLKKIGHNLDKAVDFGFFGFIAKILLAVLRFFERATGNYGWAIIILTFCIQLLVFPLTRKSLDHSLRMKELQPQLKKLQEQYKSDPKRLQAETFNLYKKNGMKFMGMEGCFPMLLQIPVFFAFYSTLNVAYELRGAPWIFWIHDLGVHDPYYVLPIIMGAGMFLQQKLTAVAADPAQARIMMFMPVMFTFMFLKLPSGLVLYWCVNSLTTIVIQKVLAAKKQADLKPAT